MKFPKQLIIVYLTAFIDMLGFSFVLPVLPFLTKELNGTSTELGILIGAYAFAQAISSLYMGYFSDKYGRKPFLLLSLLGSFLGPIAQAYSPTMIILIIARFVTGLFAGSMVLAQAYITDIIPINERPRYLAQLGGVSSAAFMFGPAVGGFLSEVYLQFPFLVAGILAGIIFFVAIFVLKESVSSDYIRENKLKRHSKLPKDAKSNSSSKIHYSVIIICALCMRYCIDSCMVVSDSMYGQFLIDTIDISTLNYSIMLCITGVLSCIVQFFIFPSLHDSCHVPITILACIGSVFVTGGFAGMTFIHSYVGSFISIGLMFFGCAFINSVSPTILSAQAPHNAQGHILSIGTMCGQVAMIISPPILGSIYEANPYVAVGSGILFGGLILIITVVLFCIPNGLHSEKRLNSDDDHTEEDMKKNSLESITINDVVTGIQDTISKDEKGISGLNSDQTPQTENSPSEPESIPVSFRSTIDILNQNNSDINISSVSVNQESPVKNITH